jgi:hypothetical protein
MPYNPSIFSIGTLTNVFKFTIITKETASILLTIFTGVGGAILLIKLLEHFFFRFLRKKQEPEPKKQLSKQKKKGTKKEVIGECQVNLSHRLIYLWGIFYVLTTILIGLRYDRYIMPISILIVFLIFNSFSWLIKQKTALIIVLLLTFSIMIFNIANSRLSLELYWEAGNYLYQEGVSYHEINAGMGFNVFYSFEYIDKLYKKFKVARPLNWQKFHPLANFFVSNKVDLEKRNPGLELYKTISKKRWFGILTNRKYIYKRKEGYKKAIFI